MKSKQISNLDPEIVAISDVYTALKDLEIEAQSRVLNYVAGKLKIAAATLPIEADNKYNPDATLNAGTNYTREGNKEQEDDGLEGISPVAKKWMTRNGLQSKHISTMFSLGVDEIDLIAKTVPGKNKKERMRNVFLLKGVAAYLSTGAARFTHEQLKEACLHYDAFDAANFAANFKTLSSEVAGNKETGYSLTPRGLANATEVVKSITQPPKAS